jgi:predicted amidohydrolase
VKPGKTVQRLLFFRKASSLLILSGIISTPQPLPWQQIGKCFVVSACATVDEYMIEKLMVDDKTADLLREPQRTGGSMIAAPSGFLIAGPMGNEEGILYADCDLELCLRHKLQHDFTGFYNRPDMFTLIQRKAPLRLFVEKYDEPFKEIICKTNQENEYIEKEAEVNS